MREASSSTCPRTVRCTSITSDAEPAGNQRGTGATYCHVVAPTCVTVAERKRQRVAPCYSVMRAKLARARLVVPLTV